MGGRSRVVELLSPDDTYRFGRHVAVNLQPGAILALFGPLGAGKTSFVQGLASGLEIKVPIQSPTFTYFHPYLEGMLPLYHFDLYRMKDASDFFAMGFEEYLDGQGINAIEWPERLGSKLPHHAISFHFSYHGEGRRVHLSSAFDSNLLDSMAPWD